jgi:hypothetical protein
VMHHRRVASTNTNRNVLSPRDIASRTIHVLPRTILPSARA